MSTAVLVAPPGEVGEDLEPMTEAQARKITERIRKGLEGVWAMMLEAYEHKAHHALGYETWEDYVKAEFQMSRGESYRHIDVGRTVRAIASASSVSRARDIAPYVSTRAAAVLKHDADAAAKEITAAVESGVEPQDAVRAAVAKRTVIVSPSSNGQSTALALPRQATVRRGDDQDEEFYLLAAVDLRERLRATLGTLKTYVGRVPRREGTDTDSLREELCAWLQTLAQFTNEDALESIYFLQAELFDWLMGLGVDRKTIGALAGVTDSNVDYWRRRLKAATAENENTKAAKK